MVHLAQMEVNTVVFKEHLTFSALVAVQLIFYAYPHSFLIYQLAVYFIIAMITMFVGFIGK